MSGKTSAYLLLRGWQRTDTDWPGECGASSDRVGFCEKSARWSKGGGFLCAQHAAQAQRLAEACPPPTLAAVGAGEGETPA